jgi:hypothetical protein
MIFDLKSRQSSANETSLMGHFSCPVGHAGTIIDGGYGWMSVNGPAATDILSGQHDPVSLNYAVVKVTPRVIEVNPKTCRA